MSRRATLLAGWALALVAIVAFASLGRWQLGRMHEKQALLDGVQAVLAERHARPLAIAADPGRRSAVDWAAGEGSFVDGPAILLDNQQREGRPGVRVYRAFRPVDAAPLLVELGWLPLPGDRATPAIALPQGTQRVQGLLVAPPSPGLVAQDVRKSDDASDLVVTRLDAELLSDFDGVGALAPRVLKLDPASPLGYARDLDVLPNTLPPQKHLGYAVQWFGLALAVLATALVLTFRKPRR